jgi:hypothetical protein
MYDYTCKSCTHEFDLCDSKTPEVCIDNVMCPICDSIEVIDNNPNN